MQRAELLQALTALGAELVLVLKCLAHRIGEDDDVRLLAAAVGLESTAAVLDLVERVAGPRLCTAQVQFFVEAVLDRPDHL